MYLVDKEDYDMTSITVLLLTTSISNALSVFITFS